MFWSTLEPGIEDTLASGYSALVNVFSYMRTSCLFLLHVPICSSWSWVKYGAWILCAAGEISGGLILVSKILTGKYVYHC
jgi:hypothetical protein